jgi:tripartite-type tricarboxylate transporter receptor subunit TctC
MFKHVRSPFSIACLALGAAFAAVAPAQAWEPTKPITIVVGFAPGGGTDVIARQLAASSQQYFPVPLVILNKPGAAGTLAAQEVARAEPDGYTLLVAGGSESTSVPAYRETAYDTRKDFRPIIRATSNPQLLVVAAGSPFKSVQDIVAKAKEKAGSLSYGTSGVGSLVHAMTEVFAKRAEIELKHIPYQGGAPALQALLAGQIDILVSALDEVQGQLDAGAIRALAVTRSNRIASFPNVPTFKEAGYEVSGDNMKGLVAPAGIPDDVYAYLHERFKKGLDAQIWQDYATKTRFTTEYLDGPAFQSAMTTLLNEISVAVKK